MIHLRDEKYNLNIEGWSKLTTQPASGSTPGEGKVRTKADIPPLAPEAAWLKPVNHATMLRPEPVIKDSPTQYAGA